ncbi:MAG: HAMP domain-containing protein [Desulfatiglans sp.]|jgi:two-component system sensor histidine kinase GlrK|nr:HAMP domain-containing protein [Desulfatiglans sp.]
MKLTIFKRLMAGFFLILLVVVALSTYSVLKFSELNQAIRSISEVDSETLRYADRLRDGIYTLRKFERKYVISEDKDFLDQFNETGKSFLRDLDQLKGLLSAAGNYERAALLRDACKKYSMKVEEEAEHVINKTGYDKRGFEEQKQALVDEVIGHLDVLREATEKAINNRIRMSGEVGQEALRVIMIMSVSSLVMAVLIAFFISRTIHRPVRLLIKGIKEIARGRFEKHIEISSPPEINELAGAFNNMCDRLKEVDELKADFIAGVSHEFRTPLAVIREAIGLYVESLEKRPAEKQQKLLTIIEEECERLITSVNRVLNLSRMDAGIAEYHMEKYSITHLVAIALSKVQPIAQRKNITLEYNPGHIVSNAFIDPEKMGLVLDNLLGNALKFTPEKGRVSVRVIERDAVLSDAGGKEKKRIIEVSISDTGPGIPEKHIHEIFDKYRKLHEKGTGLGLYISRQIINAHGGEIWVESNGKTGSTFFFTVPLSL